MRSNEENGSTVLERAFRLLEALGPEGHSLCLSELARQARLPKTTALRLANELVRLRALERTGDSYQLGLRLFELGATVGRQQRLRDAALPFMEDLYEATHETIHLGLLDGLEVLYLEKIVGRRSSAVPTRVGTRRPLYCTGLGKAILSHSDRKLVDAVLKAGLVRYSSYTITSPQRLTQVLAQASKEGVAYDQEEYKLGTCCVASPLVGRSGLAVAALSVSGPPGRFVPEHAAAAVRTAALSLSRALQGTSIVARQATPSKPGRPPTRMQ